MKTDQNATATLEGPTITGGIHDFSAEGSRALITTWTADLKGTTTIKGNVEANGPFSALTVNNTSSNVTLDDVTVKNSGSGAGVELKSGKLTLTGEVHMDGGKVNLKINGTPTSVSGLAAGSSIGVTYGGSIASGAAVKIFDNTAERTDLNYIKSDNQNYIVVYCDGTKDVLKDGGVVTLGSHTHDKGLYLAAAKKVTLSGSGFTITGSQNCELRAGNTVNYMSVTEGVNSVTLTADEGLMFDPAKVAGLNSTTDLTAVVNPDGTLTLTFGPNYSGTSISLSGFTTTAQARVSNGAGIETAYATVGKALGAAQSGQTVTVVGSTVTAVTDAAVAQGVTVVSKGASAGFTAGEGAKVSVDTNGNVTLTGGSATVANGGKVKTRNDHDVSTSAANPTTVTVGADGKETATPGAPTVPVTIDGVTYTGASEYDLDAPFVNAGITASVPVSKLQVYGNASVAVNADSWGKEPVVVNKVEGKSTVSIPTDTTATVTGVDSSGKPITITYTGPVELEILEDGTIVEKGHTVPKLTLLRDTDGKIHSNGATGVSERLMPMFDGFTPNATYYWRINGGGEWYTAAADASGRLQLNTGDKKMLVYGDYVEISGKQNVHDDVVKARLLSKELLNGTFTQNTTGSADIKPRTQIYGWRTSASDQRIEVMSVGTYLSTYGQMSGYAAELNAYQSASLYQEVDVSGERSFTWSLDYGGRGGSGDQIMAIVIGPVKEDGKYVKSSSGTKDMFQNIVAKLTTAQRPTSSKLQTGPFEIPYDDGTGEETYTVYMFWGALSKSNHFSGTIDVTGKGEMVFAFTAILPASGGSGNVLDNVKFQQPAKIYKVGQYYYETLESAIQAAVAEGGEITVNNPALMTGASQTGTLPAGDVLRDMNGNTYTGGENGAQIAVDNKGKVTVTSGTATVTPGSGNGATFGVQGKSAHDVTAKGEVTVTVTKDASGKVTGGTVTPKTSDTPVEIDGVTYKGPAGGKVSYNVDDPFGAGAPDGTSATVPASKAGDSTFRGLTVPGAEGGAGFTVKPVTGGGDVTVTKGASGVTSSFGDNGKVNGTVDVSGAAGKVNVNGTTYTVPEGSNDGVKLGLVTAPKEGADQKDVVELLGGTVEVPQGKDVYVNGVDVKNSKGTGNITVTKDMPAPGKAQVEIPAGSEVTIGGKSFPGEATIFIDENGDTSMGTGEVKLKSKTDAGTTGADKTDVTVGNASVSVENMTEGANKDVTVKVPVSDTNANGQASVPAGGSVQIDSNKYDATADTVFEFNGEGKVSITSGGTTLTDGESAGFGSVELGNDATATEPASKVTVDVVTPADGKGNGKAKVTVPAGETFTVTDADGVEHTYKNNGGEELTLTVDEDGKVTVEGKLPTDGVTIGEDTPITFKDDDGTDKTLTGGKIDAKNNHTGGTTLKPNTRTDNGENTPLLSGGSVTIPNKGGKVNVQNQTGDEKRLDGKNVEVFADDGTVKSKGNSGDGRDGEVKFENGTKYYIPDGRIAPLNSEGTGFDAPAKGIIEGNKDGPGKNPYVLVPDENSKEGDENDNSPKLYTDNTNSNDEATSEKSKKSNVFAEANAGFEIYKKKACK